MSLLGFLLVILVVFFFFYLEIISRPVISQTACLPSLSALHRRESSAEQLPKIKSVLHLRPLPRWISLLFEISLHLSLDTSVSLSVGSAQS
jgi:hypothetical protein